MSISPSILEMTRRLVAFDTTSRNSNLELIDYVRAYLADLGVDSELVHNAERTKANLYATLGPGDRPGIALSGHTDVVPVDGQAWDSDPFETVNKDDRLYGRGTCDMKGFIAVCLALASEFLARPIATPLHLVCSYDEEVGCIGVRTLTDQLATRELRPRMCIIGEPTEMQVIRAHKGMRTFRCRVRGHESHSSLTPLGVNAVEAAAEAIAYLKGMARRLRDHGPYDGELTPPYTTVHTGTISGGTALNIVPRRCEFEFEFRHLPEDDPDALFDELRAYVERELIPEMHAVDPASGFEFDTRSRMPGLATAEDAEVVQLAKALSGANRTAKVSFGTEGGHFANAGIPTVICGPGSIAQAHKPNEFITLEQLARCETFVRRLFEHCWEG